MSKKTPWEIFKSKKYVPDSFKDEHKKNYINDEGFEVPENTIAFYPSLNGDWKIEDVIESLNGKINRDWFKTTAFAFCLPLSIANQYGFVVKSNWDMEIIWDGDITKVPQVTSEGWQNHNSIQPLIGDFDNGILSLQNAFIIRTPPGINTMIVPPPNYFIPGISVMSAVIETDNLRRNFTFNLRVTEINKVIKIKKGDWLAAFMPIPRFFVDSFVLKDAFDIYDEEVMLNELQSEQKLGFERLVLDTDKINGSGRRYFKGKHVNDTDYKNHQKRVGRRD